MDVHVRGINPEIWRALRADAVSQGIPVAKLIEWLFVEHGNFGPYVRENDLPRFADDGTYGPRELRKKLSRRG
jgi:hypothetical protein